MILHTIALEFKISRVFLDFEVNSRDFQKLEILHTIALEFKISRIFLDFEVNSRDFDVFYVFKR